MPYNQTNFNKIPLPDNANSELNIIVTVYLYFHYMRSLLNRVPCVPACQSGLRANVLYVPTCLRTSVICVSTCQSVPTSYFYVPTSQ